MKRIITFFAILMCFMGAKAEWVTDYEIVYSRYSGFPFYVMGYVPEWNDGIMTDFGAMYKYVAVADDAVETSNDTVRTATGAEYFKIKLAEPEWHRYFIADGIPTELYGDYTIKAMVRASETCTIDVNMGWGWGSGDQLTTSVTIGTDWTEVEWTYAGIGGSSCFLVAQPGTVTATIEWQWVTVSHEKKQQNDIEWIEQLTNGDAETPWGDLANVQYNDWDNNYKVCAWAKEKGVNLDEDGAWVPFPATIDSEEVDGKTNHYFVVHANKIDEDGYAWDNEFWIMSPKSWKAGEQIKVHFRYKASQTVTTGTQFHSNPSGYLHWSALGNIGFTTDWQEFEQVVTIPDAAGGAWSIEFQLGYEARDAVDFYFDDLSWQAMKLDEGYFVAGANTLEGLEYDFDNAIQFEYSETDGCYIATVGSKDAYVNQVMVSTARGNNLVFRSHTLRALGTIENDPDCWLDYTMTGNALMDLPGSGIWKIYLDADYSAMAFEMLEGTMIPSNDIKPNPTVVVVHGVERDYTADEQEGGTGHRWDNQFYIVANRQLQAGEETILEFDYMSSVPNVWTSTEFHAEPGSYLNGSIGDIRFTNQWQHLCIGFEVPSFIEGMKTMVFDMALIKGACDYSIKNIVAIVIIYNHAINNPGGTLQINKTIGKRRQNFTKNNCRKILCNKNSCQVLFDNI